MSDQKIVNHFFRLLRGIYGAAKFSSQWPTEMDIHAAQKLWTGSITSFTPEELRAAINHAQKMAISGEPDWQWPNIGLILGGAKRYANASQRPFLPEPERELLPKHTISAEIAMLRKEVGL